MIEFLVNAFMWYVSCVAENMFLTLFLTFLCAAIIGLIISKIRK